MKDMHKELSVGEYMGFNMSLNFDGFSQQMNLFLRGAMTYKIDLGTDALGNITRINNALDKLSERLENAKEQLENYEKQTAAAKEELKRPFTQEAELREKESRLALLNADLNIDGDGGFEILNDGENHDEKAAPGSETEEAETDYENDEHENGEDEQEYGEDELEHTGTYGKKPPSILDDIRNISSGLKPPVQCSGKSAEIGI
jgi:hypothetical protein